MDSSKTASYKQTQLEDNWDVIVIGSGIGGLTAASLLAQYAGKKTLILERHYTVGGYTHAFRRPGYEWDVGVHYIGQVADAESSIRRVYDHVSGGRLQWQNMPDVYDRVLVGKDSFDFVAGTSRLRDKLAGCFPDERAGIDRYFKLLRSLNWQVGLFSAEKAVPGPFAKIFGGLMRWPFLRSASRTTGDVISGLTKNPQLAGVLTAQWPNYGLTPKYSSFAAHAMVTNHFLNGGSYPVGGASSIARSIIPEIGRSGGRVVGSAEVAQILVERGVAAGVRMKDGRIFRAKVVISNAGAQNTFERLLSDTTPETATVNGDLKKIPSSMSYLCLHVGVNATDAELGFDGTNIWAHPSYDHDQNLARFQQDPAAPFPCVFVSFPSAKDKTFATRFPGNATLEVITPAPYEWFAKWEDTRWGHRGDDYNALKNSFTARLKAELERLVPAVTGKIEHAELSTPITTQHFSNYPHGGAYGLASTPERFRLRSLNTRTPIRNLYLTGQDVMIPGVTGGLMGGVLCASLVTRRNLLTTLGKPFASR